MRVRRSKRKAVEQTILPSTSRGFKSRIIELFGYGSPEVFTFLNSTWWLGVIERSCTKFKQQMSRELSRNE